MKLTIASFTYDKQDGATPKKRKLLVLSEPSDSYLGLEFKELSDVANVLDYLAEKKQLEEYLKNKYQLKTANYKRFKADKVSRLIKEQIEI